MKIWLFTSSVKRLLIYTPIGLKAHLLEVAKDDLVVGELLSDNAEERKHSKAAVLELLGLDDSLLLGVGRVPAKRIESKITRLGGLKQTTRTAGSLADSLRLPVLLDAVSLNESADKEEELAELREL